MKPFLVCLLFFISTTLAFKNETEFHHRSRRQNYIWNVLKQFSFTDVNQIRTDWDIMKWSPGTVNEEKQAYVDDGTTLSIKRDTGNQCYLTLRAYRQGTNFFSARIHSKLTFTPTTYPGKKIRVEIKATLPTIEGVWPTIQLRGIDETYGPWPLSGRITMAEWYYNLGTGIRTALNWKSPADFVQDFEGLNKESMRTKYHTFGVEYSGAPNDEYVQNYVQRADGTTLWGQKIRSVNWVSTFAPCNGRVLAGAARCSPLAPFDNRMYITVGLAVGGSLGGCCGVANYNAFDGPGVEMAVKSVTVWYI